MNGKNRWRNKDTVVLIHSTKTYKGSRGIAPPTLNLGTGWRSVVKFMPLPLCPRCPLPIENETGWTQGPGWKIWMRKNLVPAGNRTQDRPARSPVTTLTTLLHCGTLSCVVFLQQSCLRWVFVSCVPACRNAEPGSPDIVRTVFGSGSCCCRPTLQTAASRSFAKHDSPYVVQGLSS